MGVLSNFGEFIFIIIIVINWHKFDYYYFFFSFLFFSFSLAVLVAVLSKAFPHVLLSALARVSGKKFIFRQLNWTGLASTLGKRD